VSNAGVFRAAVKAIGSNSRTWATFLRNEPRIVDLLGGYDPVFTHQAFTRGDLSLIQLKSCVPGQSSTADAKAIRGWAALLSDVPDYYGFIQDVGTAFRRLSHEKSGESLPDSQLLLCIVGYLGCPSSKWPGTHYLTSAHSDISLEQRKLPGMGYVLASEFLRNLHWNGFKPDRHVQRLFDRWMSGAGEEVRPDIVRLQALIGRRASDLERYLRYSLLAIAAVPEGVTLSYADNLVWLLGAYVEKKGRESDLLYVEEGQGGSSVLSSSERASEATVRRTSQRELNDLSPEEVLDATSAAEYHRQRRLLWDSLALLHNNVSVLQSLSAYPRRFLGPMRAFLFLIQRNTFENSLVIAHRLWNEKGQNAVSLRTVAKFARKGKPEYQAAMDERLGDARPQGAVTAVLVRIERYRHVRLGHLDGRINPDDPDAHLPVTLVELESVAEALTRYYNATGIGIQAFFDVAGLGRDRHDRSEVQKVLDGVAIQSPWVMRYSEDPDWWWRDYRPKLTNAEYQFLVQLRARMGLPPMSEHVGTDP
jgi:hypothetical protein